MALETRDLELKLRYHVGHPIVVQWRGGFTPLEISNEVKICDGVPPMGFTLIELLVVVAVLALLLAILMPVLRSARAVAKRMGCSSNLKQIALAWNAYLDDYDGRFYRDGNAHLEYGGWEGEIAQLPRPLNSYVGLPVNLADANEGKVFCCPADRGGRPGPSPYQKVYLYFGTSYQTNNCLIGADPFPVRPDQFEPLHEEIRKRVENININQVNNPSYLLLIGDYGWVNQIRPTPHPRPEWKKLAEWHGKEDCHNMAFLDSHVKFLRLPKAIFITEEYTTVPFKQLYGLAYRCQSM